MQMNAVDKDELNIYFAELCKKKIEVIRNQSDGKAIYIWGAAEGGRVVEGLLKEADIEIAGFVDRNYEAINEFMGYKVFPKESLCNQTDYVVVAYRGISAEILDFLSKNGFVDSACYIFETNLFSKEDTIYRGCQIGRYTYGYKKLLDSWPIAIRIGRYCSINETARICGNHPLECVTTSPILDHPGFYGGGVRKVPRKKTTH